MLCLQAFLFLKNPLWKTPVEKPVEIVEKFPNSTAISGFFPPTTPENPACLWKNRLSFRKSAVLRQATRACHYGGVFAEKVPF
jgi:hypothetical protein